MSSQRYCRFPIYLECAPMPLNICFLLWYALSFTFNISSYAIKVVPSSSHILSSTFFVLALPHFLVFFAESHLETFSCNVALSLSLCVFLLSLRCMYSLNVGGIEDLSPNVLFANSSQRTYSI